MEVILLEQVENLGNIGDQVNVKSGYGRNFLLPKGKATLATPENIAIFEARRAELEAKQAAEQATAQSRADRLAGMEITLTARAGVEGKLFGSLGTIDIAEAVTAAGVEILRSEVRLPDGPIRSTGEHELEVHLASDLNVPIKVNVVGDSDGEEIVLIDEDGADEAGEEIAE